MWCPSVSLSVWANAWLAGAAAPDDVLDALSRWAPRHFVNTYDSATADRTGLAWPDLEDAASVSLLAVLRTTARPAPGAAPMTVVLPVPGDVRGLPAGTQFQHDAITAGEAIVVTDADRPDTVVGLVPEFEFEGDDHPVEYTDPGHADAGDLGDVSALAWTVYSVPAPVPAPPTDLGEAEYALRSAVREAAEALGTLQLQAAGSAGVDDPRAMVEQILAAGHAHPAPDHAPARALRVLEHAAHVDAIITVSAGLLPIGLQSASQVQLAGDALRPLAAVVRSARLAAVNAILHSAWR